MSGDNMKFSDSKFDCVISFDVFEHIPDSDKHLSEVNRVLKMAAFIYFKLQTNGPIQYLKQLDGRVLPHGVKIIALYITIGKFKKDLINIILKLNFMMFQLSLIFLNSRLKVFLEILD